ncbi:MAG: ATPase [Pseudomonadota bacterium]
MPQIAQLATTYSSQIFWLLVCFGLVFFVVGRGMVPKVMATVDARDNQIAADLAAAEAARKAADAEEDSWRLQANRQRAEAHALIAAAKGEAAKETDARLASAGRTIDARLAEAEGRIAAARQGAQSEIEAVAAQAAGDIVSRLTGFSIDDVTARAAVKEVLHG